MNDRDETRPTMQRRFAAGERVAVLLPLPLQGTLDYAVAAGDTVTAGAFVEVPLGRRSVVGVVWGPGGDTLPAARLKPLLRHVDLPPLSPVVRRFVDWVAEHTVQPPGAVLRMVMSGAAAGETPTRRMGVCAAAAATPGMRLTAARLRVLEAAGNGPPRSLADLARAAGVTPAVVHGMIKSGALVAQPLVDRAPPWPTDVPAGPPLTPPQKAAAEALMRTLGDGFSVVLLDGVPGSGKTEVYFEAIVAALRQRRQTLVLLPEIALSAQWLKRFEARFGVSPAVWHSEVSGRTRRETWRRVAEGLVPVVVGARSALFLPFPALGLIIVDEEHDPAFKQEDGVAYHARDMAVVRSRFEGIPLVLVSATPALETVVNVREGRYRALKLPGRFAPLPPPSIERIDLKREPPPRGEWLSPPLRAAIAATLSEGEQILLFLNRRGYAPLTLCRACGHRLGCPNCSAWLVEHRLMRRLTCHHCGHTEAVPTACPACGAPDSLIACGPGVERVAEEVATLWPEARLALATSDTLTSPAAAATLVDSVERHAVDVLIGTQLIAKGYHFPLLTLVGVVDADLGLAGGELRAAERTFQLLSQVSGRAGRERRTGRVLLQTSEPDHPVIVAIAAADRDGFLAAEEADRRRAGMPPFGRLAALILSSRDEASVDRAAAALARASPILPDVRVLGPAPAPLSLLHGRHRRRFLIKAPRRAALAPLIRDWLKCVPLPGDVRLQVDIDPQSFL
jgi:primosomal protein N' (replication factor Y)